ncbi:GMP synthase-like glutamine amidotransferase [Amycolatopsis bartoniae]|uniref:type 1 glutamine amidotransferase n=1 Tax=Amycolatopsis bartoniae TaxID=941986 RepID=UPI0011929E8C|nr:type 1 glutamine amidotransferase [Amycolatopsis bartoniae]MBB2938795.1 GMP synthase-like glutamine amidotransferase [Amycolatopsis bartoniae]TVS99160.1 type 1 glutamine amidotransferase [Amycolatopsis bartoniae]
MNAPRLLVIQPDESDPLGPLGEWLTAAGAELDVRRPFADGLPAGLDDYEGLICLGGGMNAEEDDNHPWLKDVRNLLARAAHTNLPTLGICLGAQLLAVATGGVVAPGEKGPEVGPYLVSKKDAAWTDPLFADLPLMPDVLHFHVDEIRRLPASAVLLASAPKYLNQAFRLGRCAYGIQFHIETTVEVVQAWAADEPELAATARPGVFETEALAQVHQDIADTWQPFATRFVRLAAGELQPVEPAPNTLPLA